MRFGGKKSKKARKVKRVSAFNEALNLDRGTVRSKKAVYEVQKKCSKKTDELNRLLSKTRKELDRCENGHSRSSSRSSGSSRSDSESSSDSDDSYYSDSRHDEDIARVIQDLQLDTDPTNPGQKTELSELIEELSAQRVRGRRDDRALRKPTSRRRTATRSRKGVRVSFALKRRGMARTSLTSEQVRLVKKYLDAFSAYLEREGIVNEVLGKTLAGTTTFEFKADMDSAYKTQVKPAFRDFKATKAMDSSLRNYVVELRSVSS